MNSDDYIGQENKLDVPKKDRKSGRPGTISPPFEPVITVLYKRGYGYRAIARILRQEHHLNPDYSSVRRALKRLGLLS